MDSNKEIKSPYWNRTLLLVPTPIARHISSHTKLFCVIFFYTKEFFLLSISFQIWFNFDKRKVLKLDFKIFFIRRICSHSDQPLHTNKLFSPYICDILRRFFIRYYLEYWFIIKKYEKEHPIFYWCILGYRIVKKGRIL